MKLEYKLAAAHPYPSKETLKTCDEGAKAFQSVIVRTAQIISPLSVPFIWFLTRFYQRKIEDGKISYDFYLLNGKSPLSEEEGRKE